MPLPVERPCPANDDSGKVFLISLRKTDFANGVKVVNEIPRYDLGAFSSELDAEKICARMNQRLWRIKEIEFHTTLGAYARNDGDDAESGLEYTEAARRTDQEMEHFRVIPLDLRNYSQASELLYLAS